MRIGHTGSCHNQANVINDNQANVIDDVKDCVYVYICAYREHIICRIDKKMGSLAKTAHEMAIDGDEPPPRYFINESTFGSIDASPPPLPIPTIDISLLSLPSSGEEVEQLRSALSSWGCFQVLIS